MTRTLYDRFPKLAFRRPPELDGRTEPARVVVLGAGPVGLTLALALAGRGIRSVVIEPRSSVGYGSRAICLSRRSLEIWDRLGVVAPIVAQALPWTSGRSYWGDREILEFHMPHDDDQKFPPMVNLQQCFVEQYLIDAAAAAPEIDLRWRSTAIDLRSGDRGVALRIDSPAGAYELEAEWLAACDGARSFARRALGLSMTGTSYEGRYLIADIELASTYPTERRAWFDPPSNPGSTLLMHRQPENVWRIDYQLRDDEDEDVAVRDESVRARVEAHLAYIGEGPDYRLIWHSLYKAHAVSLERYRHGRVLFAGDAAHLVPIFGVRGLNSGVDDAFNLAWKLANVLERRSEDRLLESYSSERVFAARENIRQSRKSTLFMTPPTRGFELLRDAALALAVDAPFARGLVDPRQTSAIAFPDSPLSTEDAGDWGAGTARPGATLPQVRIERSGEPGHLLDALGTRPLALVYG
ncbi:MAG: FAD-dependent monooxygenase, partial [Candidatus Eremiobacteraeota bacterium]|nr:FAD-dependent monooxygenase [Candidatus Eremiobacteraeota bacterium]